MRHFLSIFVALPAKEGVSSTIGIGDNSLSAELVVAAVVAPRIGDKVIIVLLNFHFHGIRKQSGVRSERGK